MAAEDLVVNNLDDVVVVIPVPVLQVLQDPQLYTGLILESFFIPNNFNGNHLLLFVIEAFESLAEASAAQLVNHLVSVGQMIIHNYLVVPSFIIVAKIVVVERRALDLRCG